MTNSPEPAPPGLGGRSGPPLPPGAVMAGSAVAALAWLLLRPTSPTGVAAAADILVLPALLFLAVRLVMGRPTVAPAVLAAVFGIGAVLGAVAALVLQWPVDQLVGRSGLFAAGPVIETLAACGPVVLVVAFFGAGGHRLGMADTTLAGLCGGLGFLVVQTGLATATLHAGPTYPVPLLAGLVEVPASAGSPAAYFAGPALAGALVGVILGALRAGRLTGASRAAGTAAAVSAAILVTFDHAVFDWRLHHLVDGEEAVAGGLVSTVHRLALHGRLGPAVVVVVVVAAGLASRRTAGSPLGTGPIDLRERLAGDTGAGRDGEAVVRRVAASADGRVPGAGRTVAPAAAFVLVIAAGVTLVALARADNLGFLTSRPLAGVVCVAGLAYSLWHLPAPGDPDPSTRLRLVLGGGAVAASVLGLACVALPAPDAAPAPHGGLFLETALAWGSGVGNLGLLFGLGGFAAPAGSRGHRRFGDRWNGSILRWLGWTGWDRAGRAVPSREGAGAGLGGTRRGRDRRRRVAASRGGRGAEFLWFRLSGTRLGRVLRRGDGSRATSSAVEAPADADVVLAVEPIYRSLRRAEFVGATVQDAIATAMRELGAGLAYSSLQLIDPGTPPTKGRPGTGRPARVRVADAHEAPEHFLVPPARDSILRTTPFAVVVSVAVDDDEVVPESVTVSMRAGGHHLAGRPLVCSRTDGPEGMARYRSNPYTVSDGEDVAFAGDQGGTGAPALRVTDGGELKFAHGGQSAAITVYESWFSQVLGVSRRLLDATERHHRELLAELEAMVPAAGTDEAAAAGRCADRLRRRLELVDEGRRILNQQDTDPVETAFALTAVLHAAMSPADEDVSDAAADALRSHRATIGHKDAPVSDAFRAFLLGTAPGELWARGAYDDAEVARLLGWDRFADPAARP